MSIPPVHPRHREHLLEWPSDYPRPILRSATFALPGIATFACWLILASPAMSAPRAGRSLPPPASATPTTTASTIPEGRTIAPSDDAEEFADSVKTMYLKSSDLELTHDTYDQTVGMRWTGLTIPSGSTIAAAYIQFTSKESNSQTTNLTISGQAADNATTFTSTLGDISSRPRTAARIGWAPVPWVVGEVGPNQQTPDLSAVIQEIVNRPGWASGNALVLIITGTGHRTAWAYDGSPTQSPLLHVEYASSSIDNPPTARLSVTQASSPALTVTADASASTDPDATPIASYRFDFGDGSAAVTTTAPTATAQHTYAAAGTYTVTLTATDTGNNTSAPATASITVTSSPPPDNPPTASLTVTVSSTSPLTVTADGSASTDTDATPIASYRFDFGDGTAAVTTTAPTATAQHTYAAAGTYTVTLTVTDTGNHTSAPVTKSVTVSNPDNPPVASLTVTVSSTSPLTVTADGSRSTDTDATPIASYRFTFGDGSAAVTTTAPTATAQHTYAASGTYTVTLTVTDTGNKTSAPVTKSVTVTSSTGSQVAVYAGYYDTHHGSNIKPKPNPWKGSSNVVFVGNADGSSGGWDTSAIRLDNLSGGTLSGVVVTVDIGSSHFALWGTHSLAAGQILICAQTSKENFDGSDLNPAGCPDCNPNDCTSKKSSTIPVVHVTIGGVKTDYIDSNQLLNTHGVDSAGCPYTGTRNDESEAWQRINPKAAAAAAARPGGADSQVKTSGSSPDELHRSDH